MSRPPRSGILAPVLPPPVSAIAAFVAVGTSVGLTPPKPAAPLGRPTIIVVPLQNRSSGDVEYGWIGHAAAEVIATQLIARSVAPVVPFSALNAFVRKHDLTFDKVREGAGAVAVARTLGAETLISGSFQASWPDVEITAWTTRGSDGAVPKKVHVQGHLEQLIPLLEDLTVQLTKALEWPVPKGGTLGTSNLYAFREAMLGLEILSLQNYGPRQRPTQPATTFKVAKLHCEKALELEKRWAVALGCLAAADALLGDAGDAAKQEEPVRRPGPVPAAAIAADRMSAAKRPAQAVELADRAKGAAGFSALAPLAAYRALWSKGEQAQALAYVQQAADRYPSFLAALACAGEHHQAVEDHAGAKKSFERFLQISPDNPYALVRLGKSLARLKDGAQALALTAKAVEKAPGEVELLVELGSRQIDLGQNAEAKATLEKAIALEKRDARAYLRLGYLHLIEMEPDKAIAILNRSIAEANLDEEWRVRALAYYDLARAHGQKKAVEDAFKALELAAQSGYEDHGELANEPDFDALKKDPRWSALVARVQR